MIKLLAVLLLLTFIINVTDWLQTIQQDTSYIRRTLQFDEEPIDPFCIGTVVYEHIEFNKQTTEFTDTIQFLCAPEDSSRLKLLFEPNRVQTCELGWCNTDSIISINYEYIE